MKASLIFLLVVALYGAVAQETESSSEEITDADTASSSSDIGAKVQAVLDNVADLSHAAFVNGTARFNSTLNSALDVGTGLVEKATQIHANLVANLTSAAQGMADKGIEHLTQIQAKLQSSPFSAFISPALNLKIQGLKLAQQKIGALGQIEAGKTGLMAKAATGAASAARGFASAAADAATTGSGAANSHIKNVNGHIAGKIGALANLGTSFASSLSGALSSGAAGLSGSASANRAPGGLSFSSFLG